MSDITTVWDVANGRGDWVLVPPDLLSGSDLETAVLISLFTDRIADPDDKIPDGSGDPRGWWGDLGADRPIGSKIWLRLRSKETDQTLALVKGDIEAALEWLLDDGVASAVAVLTEWTRPTMLGAKIDIDQPGIGRATFRFAWVWNGVN